MTHLVSLAVDGGLNYPEVDAPPLPSVLGPPNPGRKPPAPGSDVIGGKEPPPLAVDEDDYLQPKSSKPAPYMDIIPDSRGAGSGGTGEEREGTIECRAGDSGTGAAGAARFRFTSV